MKFEKGEYYIGDLSYIYEKLEILQEIAKNKSGIYKIDENFIGIFFTPCIDDICDNFGFSYALDTQSIGFISANFIDTKFLTQKIKTYKNSKIYSKVSGCEIAKVVRFDKNFEVEISQNLFKIGEISFEI